MSTTDPQSDRDMRRALALAERGRGHVEPNPMVGAVLVRGDQIVAEGYHHQFGAAHAEIDVLHKAKLGGVDPADCHLFVTLEPCCHHGKTAPCTDAIIAAGIRRVSAAMRDPFPQVDGKGIAQLEAAGIHVDVGQLEREARQLNAPFIKRAKTGLPWVILKWAQTLDGKIATASGDSKWISNATSRQRVHELRARVDAIMVGIGTVLADDPLLTARDVAIVRPARRVVVDPQLRISADAALIRSLNGQAPPVTIAVSGDALHAKRRFRNELEARGVELIALPDHSDRTGQLTIHPLLQHLGQRYEATNVLVEGGANLFGGLVRERLADQVLAFVAPRLLRDVNAISAVHGSTRDQIAEADTLQLRGVERLGDDVLLDYWLLGSVESAGQ